MMSSEVSRERLNAQFARSETMKARYRYLLLLGVLITPLVLYYVGNYLAILGIITPPESEPTVILVAGYIFCGLLAIMLLAAVSYALCATAAFLHWVVTGDW